MNGPNVGDIWKYHRERHYLILTKEPNTEEDAFDYPWVMQLIRLEDGKHFTSYHWPRSDVFWEQIA